MKKKYIDLLAELERVRTEIKEIEELIETIKIENEDLKGYLVFKLIKCGKASCHCMNGGKLHGPYPHLQWWENGKIKTKYLSRKVYPQVKKDLENLERIKQQTRKLKRLRQREYLLEKRLENK